MNTTTYTFEDCLNNPQHIEALCSVLDKQESSEAQFKLHKNDPRLQILLKLLYDEVAAPTWLRGLCWKFLIKECPLKTLKITCTAGVYCVRTSISKRPKVYVLNKDGEKLIDSLVFKYSYIRADSFLDLYNKLVESNNYTNTMLDNLKIHPNLTGGF